MKFNLNLNKILIAGGVIASLFIVAFFIWWHKEIVIDGGATSQTIGNNIPRSPISGVPCTDANRRPVAVMFSSDPVARPLSGISQADIVFEMPVTPGGVSRMMAVYQCESPQDIGSVRSAREDFIPLAASLGAVYAHWGGEKVALEKLNKHILDNIDAMKYETIYFYRKPGLKQPHNGFTGFDKIWKAVGDLKYDNTNTFAGYPHNDKEPAKNLNSIADTVSINYSQPFNVGWVYDIDSNSYKRLRGGEPEIDKNTGAQVASKVVVVMKTVSSPINKDYININVVGQGDVAVYQNGIKINGIWKKDEGQLSSKLFFYNDGGKEIEFAPGKIWVEILVD